MSTNPIFRWTIAIGLSCFGLSSVANGQEAGPEALSAEFGAKVRPFLDGYCLKCHQGEMPKSDLNLGVFDSVASVAKDLTRWELVLERIEDGTMPPEEAKQPDDDSRRATAAWIKDLRKNEAAKHAGDPGRVLARRLSNAEYDYTIRDLTGVDLRPTREFPVDPANSAGFDNSAESLAMSPALFKKYLDAARYVSDHLVIKSEGFDFAPYPMLADTDRDKFCVKAVIDFYKRQNTDLADYFLAATRYRRQSALKSSDASLDTLADQSGLSRKYLATVWATLNDGPAPGIGPIAALRSLWNSFPTPGVEGQDDAKEREACRRMSNFVVKLRQRLVPEVKPMNAKGISPGTQPFVLWLNRRIAENRMKYVGNASTIKIDDFQFGEAVAKALRLPSSDDETKVSETGFEQFCQVFPDAFYVSERSRVYLGEGDAGNTGRLLSAGFHSMTGYFRDDAPLSELLLDDSGKRDLDRLWRDFDFVTRAPIRQYASYLWYERAETGFMRGDKEFDFVRAEDLDASSEDKMGRLKQVYLAKAKRRGAGDEALQAIDDQFRIIGQTIRGVEKDRRESEPRHVEALQKFAERAFRRPISDDERQGIADFYRSLHDDGGMSHEDAVRDTLASLLVSPNFCYRLDLPTEGESAVQPLSAYDLASRLSYFLWASMPDEELLKCAASGDLQRQEVLVKQAQRLLRDPKAIGLAKEFGGNWLDFRRFEEHNAVDRGRFPTFNDSLRRSMFEEPVRFLMDVIVEDRPVSEFLEAKHTFVNAPLAKHYGLDVSPNGEEWVRVDDADRYGRGGLLPMAIFLTKNSPGLRTSPVKRGYWVVKRLLGENIPAPPAKVPDLPDDESKLGDRTLREMLASHRADKACAVCHERFDAVGLAFEGYGPVGEFRKLDLGGKPIDARAAFPGGREGDGLNGLRDYIHASRLDDFKLNLCRKLLAYGLGRTLIPSDDETVAAMLGKLDAEGGRFGALVESIVISPQFRNKRVRDEQAE